MNKIKRYSVRFVFLCISQFFYFTTVLCQTAIGFQLNGNKEFMEVHDPGGQLLNHAGATNSGYITYSRLFAKNFLFETGLGLKAINTSLTFENSQIVSSGHVQIQMPLAIGYRFQIAQTNFNVYPSAGIILNVNALNDMSISGNTISTFSSSLEISAQTTYPNAYTTAAFVGLRLEYLISRHWAASLCVSYTKGSKIVARDDVRYSINSQPEILAQQNHFGTYLSIFCMRVSYYIPWKKIRTED